MQRKALHISPKKIQTFQETVLALYRAEGRSFPWRDSRDPYHIYVSEIMLQQTQAPRVIEKYNAFIKRFPSFDALSRARFSSVLKAWVGLGYNRRAKYVWEGARRIVREYGGVLPKDPEVLVTFPGVGPATAASMSAFAYNAPTVFIETNIRSVFIHFFFRDDKTVSDEMIRPLVEKALYADDPRIWYFALMDYGVMLKKERGNPSRKSTHYTKQSPFKGSRREARGKIVRALLERPFTLREISQLIERDMNETKAILERLLEEHMIQKQKNRYTHI